MKQVLLFITFFSLNCVGLQNFAMAESTSSTLSLGMACDEFGGKTHSAGFETLYLAVALQADGTSFHASTLTLNSLGYSLQVKGQQVILSSSSAAIVLGNLTGPVAANCPANDFMTKIDFVQNPSLKVETTRSGSLITTTLNANGSTFTFSANLDNRCEETAIAAATLMAFATGQAYHCVAAPSDTVKSQEVYSVRLICNGDTGTQSFSYRIEFGNTKQCLIPKVTAVD